MARGQPDYGLTTQTPVASGISDPGEAAARLGSINVYDRRGWTVWMDDFEAPDLKWLVVIAGVGVGARLVTTASWMGVQSAYLSSPAGVISGSSIAKIFPLLRLGRLGVEFWVRGYTRTPGYFACAINIFDGVNQSQATLFVDFEANTVSIMTPLGIFVIDTGSFPALALMPFIPIKVVVDIDTDTYVRLLVGPNEYDITAHELINLGATTNRIIRVSLYTTGAAIADMYAWVDNFILTQNEP